MKLTELLFRDDFSVSFEVFPPKTDTAFESVKHATEEIASLRPSFMSVTYGAKVTLRGDRMYEFVDRLFNVALPRVRDFRGINANSFDGRGNYNMGLKEQLIFPEIDYDKIDKVRGMDLCFVTTATTDEEARELLTLMGAPFAK